MDVYADVLVVLNLYINYFLVRCTAILLRRDISAKRCLLAAGIGAAASLVMLLPPLPVLASAASRIVVGLAITLAAFGRQKKADFAVSALCFLVISFTFGGLMMGLWMLAAPFGMVYDNGVCYFDIPITAVALFTIIGYAAVKVIKYFSGTRVNSAQKYAVKITANGCECTLSGFADTGNMLIDVFSGKRVVVCCLESIATLIPENVFAYLNGKEPEGIRLVPCSTVSAEALIPVFGAQIEINGKNADALVGVSKKALGEGIDCIFNPDIIPL